MHIIKHKLEISDWDLDQFNMNDVETVISEPINQLYHNN